MKTPVTILLALLALTLGSSAAWSSELAKVNGHGISDKDLEGALANLNEGQRDSVLKDPNSRRQILLSLIDQEVLIQEGEKEKLDQDQTFKDALAAFRKQYLASKVLEKNLAAKLTDKAAKKYYEAHKSRFSTDQVHVQHILAADEPAAREYLKKAKEAGADFMALAEQYSRDPSAKNNRGDLGLINHDSPFVSDFKDAAFSGNEGDIVGPIKTTYGYHIIKVVKKKIGKPLEYDEVELKVKGEMRDTLVQNYLSQLKAQAKVSIDDKALDKM